MFVAAYDTRTGKKLPHLVPEHYFTHPVLGRHLSKTPSTKARKKAAREADPVITTETPAAGDDQKKE